MPADGTWLHRWGDAPSTFASLRAALNNNRLRLDVETRKKIVQAFAGRSDTSRLYFALAEMDGRSIVHTPEEMQRGPDGTRGRVVRPPGKQCY